MKKLRARVRAVSWCGRRRGLGCLQALALIGSASKPASKQLGCWGRLAGSRSYSSAGFLVLFWPGLGVVVGWQGRTMHAPPKSKSGGLVNEAMVNMGMALFLSTLAAAMYSHTSISRMARYPSVRCLPRTCRNEDYYDMPGGE